MRHRKANVKLGRTAAHRKAMLRNMATSIFECGAITTTVMKAKALKPIIDNLITLAKRGDLAAIRQARAILTKPAVVRDLFAEAKDKYQDRVSGYAAMAKVGLRAGDAAPMARLTLIGPDYDGASKGRGAHKSVDRARRVAATRQASLSKEAAPESVADFVDEETKSTVEELLESVRAVALAGAKERAVSTESTPLSSEPTANSDSQADNQADHQADHQADNQADHQADHQADNQADNQAADQAVDQDGEDKSSS